MKADLHLHSTFSADSICEPEALVRLAIMRGYSHIAITDHYDLIPSEIAVYGVAPYRKYRTEIRRLQAKYPEIRILPGMEAGELHRVEPLLTQIQGTEPVDMLIGSIHVLASGKNISVPFDTPLTQDEINDYYRENLMMVANCRMDVLGHLGIYKRYYAEHPQEEDACEPVIKEIFSRMIQKAVALEVNYSGLRKTLGCLIPEPQHLRLYLEMGGELLTIGSDSHAPEQLDDYYPKAISQLHALGIHELYWLDQGCWKAYGI